MTKSLSRILTLTKRNITEILRDPLSLVFLVGMPLFLEILFYFIFHSMTSQFEMKYLAPGIVVFSQAFLCLFSGLQIAIDRGTAFLVRLYVSRARSYEFILGYACAMLPIAFGQSVLFFLVGGIIDSSIFSFAMIPATLLSLLTAQLFVALGILFGSLCNEKSIGGVASIVIAGQSLLSGMWFPTEGLNGTIITLMNVLPFRNATSLVMNTINGIGDGWQDFFRPLLIVLCYTIAAFVAAILVFRSKMKAK